MNNKEQLNALSKTSSTNWIEEAKYRRDNQPWLRRSALIAVQILTHLREQGLTQKELAEKMNVSPQYINKLLKGSENLSLETVSKIESVLSIQLIHVVSVTTAQINVFTPRVHRNPVYNPEFSIKHLEKVDDYCVVETGNTTQYFLSA